jgi:hypothetical protein
MTGTALCELGGVMRKKTGAAVGMAALAVAWLAGSAGAIAATPQDVRDYDNATRLHILFSEVPDVYCKTPAAVAAERTLRDELDVVDKAIDGLYYDLHVISDFGRVSTKKVLPEGAQPDLDSLWRIKHRLYAEWIKLASLPPCDTGYVPAFYNGVLVGLYVVKSTSNLFVVEHFIATDAITNQFKDSHDPAGVGIHVSYGFTPWNNSVVVAPFVSLDYPNTSVFHSFAGGSYLGTTSNLVGTFGVKVGPAINPDLWLYGIAGASVLNETLKINFIPAFSSTTATVGGGTLGAGFAWHPKSWQIANHPVSLFGEYQHTWWQTANYNAPTASPAFGYSFSRSDDVIKLGVNISLSDPGTPAPARPSYPVKALPPK